jgi:tetratricopeptide (TPR) repeat protein
MTAGANHELIGELLQAADAATLTDLVERNLTKFGDGVEDELLRRAEQFKASDPEAALRLREIYQAVRASLEAGNYRRARFDEAEPANPKEVLLAAARRLERGEAELSAVVEQAVAGLTPFPFGKLYLAWADLSLSMERRPEMHDYVALGEILYGAARQVMPPSLFPHYGPAYNALQAAARNLIEQERYVEAIPVFERLAAIAEENDEPDLLCRALLSLGDLWRDRMTEADHFDRAESFYTRALRLCEERGLDESLRIDARLQLGKMWAEQGRLGEACEQLELALTSCREHGLGRSAVAYDCLSALVSAYFEAKDYATVGRHLLTIFALARDPTAEADIPVPHLINLAGMLGRVAQMIGDEMGDAVSEAVKLAAEMSPDRATYMFRSSAYAALGIYCKQRGDWQGALDAYRDAIAAAEAAGNERAAARWLSDMRHVYLVLNRWDEAEEIARRVARVYVRLKDYQGAANRLIDEGHLRLQFDRQPARAAYSWAEAFVLFHRVGQSFGMGYAALNLNRVYREASDWERAEACLRYCLSKAREDSAPRLKVYALGELAWLQAVRGERSEAVETYGEAIALAEESGELVEQDFRFRRAELLEALGRARPAAEDYRRVIALNEAARGRLRAAEHRVQAQGRSEQAYARLVSLLARSQGSAGEAFATAEKAHSRTLAELLSRRPIRPPASLPPTLMQREQALLEQLLRLEESDEQGLSPSQQYARLAQELNEVWREMAAADEAGREYSDLRRSPVLGGAEVALLLRDL